MAVQCSFTEASDLAYIRAHYHAVDTYTHINDFFHEPSSTLYTFTEMVLL